jgi:hypothetical protein
MSTDRVKQASDPISGAAVPSTDTVWFTTATQQPGERVRVIAQWGVEWVDIAYHERGVWRQATTGYAPCAAPTYWTVLPFFST